VIDLKNKNIISFEISERDVATENKKSFTNIPFVNTGATDVSRLEIAGTRGKAEGSTGNGINTDFQQRIDNISIYTMHQVAAAADVTIKYKDENGVEIKTPRVVKDQEVGTTYTSIAADKVTILFNDEYYLFDESTIDNVTVATGGSEIIIKFIKATPKN